MIEGAITTTGKPSLSFGLVGGGPGSFIGDVHIKAARFDNRASLAAGCFSREHEKTLSAGHLLGVPRDRCYRSFAEMAERESRREDGIDFVAIATPNNTHYPIAREFLERGIPVMCDKPLTVEVEEAEELAALARSKDLLFAVSYAYSGYPMVKHARDLIRQGEIGALRFVQAEYPQEWLATLLEDTGHRQASWRSDPRQAGKSACVGDIGSHIENTVSYMTGLRIRSLCARLDTLVPGRRMDDNASILVNYEGGARGLYWCSQVAVGCDNALSVRLFGEKGAIEFRQEDPNYLKLSHLDKPSQRISRGRDRLSPRAAAFSRLPGGHPEGYYEAFANTYAAFMQALLKKRAGERLSEADLDFPGVEDGVRGVKFISRCVQSTARGAVWVDF